MRPGCFARTPYGRGRVTRVHARMPDGRLIVSVTLDRPVKAAGGWLTQIDVVTA